MKLKPRADKIVVLPLPRIKSEIIEVVMTENDNMGTVVAVGPGGWNVKGKIEPTPVAVGDLVRFGTMGKDEYLKYSEYIEDGVKYLIMSWKDICFVQEAA